MKKVAASILSMLLFFGTYAQEEEKPVKNTFMGTRFINFHSANVAGKYELQMLIQHRFGDISGGFYELFGLDDASMRIGFDYGVTKNLNIGIGRSSFMKTFDSFVKYRFLTQSSSMPLSFTATVAGSFPTLKNIIPEAYDDFSEKASGNVQLHVAKSFNNFAVQVSPGYIGTGYIPVEMDSYSFLTMAFGGAVKLAKKVSLNIEYLHRFEDEINYANPFSASIDLGTAGHLFQIMVSNGQQIFDQAVITHTTGSWRDGNLFLGFNLIRGFNFKQY